MAIRNINAIVDKNGLGTFNESEYLSQYYNEALANLGQRNTQEQVIGYGRFTIQDMFRNIGHSNDCPATNLVLSSKNEENIYHIKFGELEFIGYKEGELYDNVSPYITLNSSNMTNSFVIGLKQLMIIRELCKSILDNDFTEDDATERQISFPVNYQFEYIYDGVNVTNIYGSNNDIYCYVIPNFGVDENNWKSDYIYTTNSQDFIKTSVYSFSMDNDNPVVYRKFVLPYVDKSNKDNNIKTWWINGKDSSITAEAKEAIYANIILLLSYNDGNDYTYLPLSGLPNRLTVIPSNQTRNIYLLTNDNKRFILKVNIPNIITREDNLFNIDENIRKEWDSYIKNSTLIVLTDINSYVESCEDEDSNVTILSEITQEELIERYGTNGIITTIWKFDEDLNNYNFVNIKDDTDINGNKIALDFGRLGNFASLIDYKANQINQIKPDNFIYRHLIFENILQGEKHSTNYSYVYPTFRNIRGINLSNSIGNDYMNDLNFSLRYISTINGEIGKDITSLGIKNETTFFSPSSVSAVTNSLYQYTQNNATNYYAEYVPNFNIPIFDFSEILTKDINVLNRHNILSFDGSGKVYYAYLGTSFSELDKSVLHLGTNNTNINLGKDTLMNEGDKNQFLTHNKLSIDFNNIDINGNTDIKGGTFSMKNKNSSDEYKTTFQIDSNGNTWKVEEMGNNTVVYSMTITPKFKYPQGKPYLTVNITNENDVKTTLRNFILNECPDDSRTLYVGLYFQNKVNNNYLYYKHGDLLIIKNLIKALGYTESSFTEGIESNTNDIIRYQGNAKYLVSSSSQLLINILSNSVFGNTLSIETKDIYIGNALDIIIVSYGGKRKLIINEHTQSTLGSIWRLPLNI